MPGSEPFVDSDVNVRLLTGDDPATQEEAAALFQAVEAGRLTIAAPDTVIADAVFVLSSPPVFITCQDPPFKRCWRLFFA